MSFANSIFTTKSFFHDCNARYLTSMLVEVVSIFLADEVQICFVYVHFHFGHRLQLAVKLRYFLIVQHFPIAQTQNIHTSFQVKQVGNGPSRRHI